MREQGPLCNALPTNLLYVQARRDFILTRQMELNSNPWPDSDHTVSPSVRKSNQKMGKHIPLDISMYFMSQCSGSWNVITFTKALSDFTFILSWFCFLLQEHRKTKKVKNCLVLSRRPLHNTDLYSCPVNIFPIIVFFHSFWLIIGY